MLRPKTRLTQVICAFALALLSIAGANECPSGSDELDYGLSWVEMTEPDPQLRPPQRQQHAMVAYNGFLYAAGGFLSSAKNDLWEYNLATKVWTNLPGLPGFRRYFGLAAYNGVLYVGFGNTGGV